MFRLPRFHKLLLVLTCCLSIGAAAESAPRFTGMSVVHGLSQNSVWCILRDKQGFLWFGTDDGLNKYDGYHFTIYRTNKNDSTTISQNTTRTLMQDRKGTIWIGTSGGLNVYDPVTDRFSLFTLPDIPAGRQRHLVVTSIAEDPKGNIWIGTRFQGLFRIGAAGGVKHYTNDPKNPSSLSGVSVRVLYVDKAGVLWVGTEGAGLNRFVESSGTFLSFRADKTKKDGLRDDTICSLFEDARGRFWVGTQFDGIMKFDRASGRCTYYEKQIATLDDRMDTLTVLTIADERHGRIMYGTFGAGLKFLDPETGAVETWRNDMRDPHSLGSNFVISMYRDESGCMWVGTYTNGISKYDPKGEHFLAYKNELPQTTLFSDNNMRAIYRDRDGLIWIGTVKGLDIFNPSSGRCEHYFHSDRNAASLSDNYVSSLFEDSRGTVWIGTRKGLDWFDRRTKRITRLAADRRTPQAVAVSNIRAIVEDKRGVLWVGTPYGLVSFDPRVHAFKSYVERRNDPKALSSNNVRALFVDHAGTLWIGTYGGGLVKMDRTTETFRAFMHDPNGPNSLSGDLTAPITEDQEGNLWVGTYGSGINKFNPVTETFRVYTEDDGLTNNTIFGIEVDGKGSVWIATTHGLSRLDPETNTFRNYTTASGLQGEEFNLNSCFKDADGTLFFGGNSGFNMFHPDRIRDNGFIPPVYVTSMTIFNKPARFDTAMAMKKRIVLSYDENSISFDFVALNYRKSELNQYRYMLEGFDREWRQPGTARRASYTNLVPGEYVFRVMGSNNDAVWDSVGTSITVIIEPPFWKTWWAYVLYVFGFGSALAGAVEIAQRRQMRRLVSEQQRREAEVVRQKNIKLKEANDEILRQQEVLKERNEQIVKANRELRHEIEHRELLLSELKTALENVKTLGGLIPICSSCKKIRDDEGYWNILETYLIKHSDAQFSHGICPECAERLYPKYLRAPGEKQDAGPRG